MRSDPNGFYTDLHTNEFPDGAVRAQLHLLTHPVSTSGVAVLQESVVLGSQIYACTVQRDGTFAFTQNNVEARLSGGIHHTFVQPAAGPPQWQAPDGSAVSGKVVTKNANGDANIAELNLDATQIGRPRRTARQRRRGAPPQHRRRRRPDRRLRPAGHADSSPSRTRPTTCSSTADF